MSAPAARVAALLLALLGGCGIKGPPRASTTTDQSPPSELFKPVADPGKPSVPGEEPAR